MLQATFDLEITVSQVYGYKAAINENFPSPPNTYLHPRSVLHVEPLHTTILDRYVLLVTLSQINSALAMLLHCCSSGYNYTSGACALRL